MLSRASGPGFQLAASAFRCREAVAETRDGHAGGPGTGSHLLSTLVFCPDLSGERQWPAGALASGSGGAAQVFGVLLCSNHQEPGPWGLVIALTAVAFPVPPPTRSASSRQLLRACNPVFALHRGRGRRSVKAAPARALQSLGGVPSFIVMFSLGRRCGMSLPPGAILILCSNASGLREIPSLSLVPSLPIQGVELCPSLLGSFFLKKLID